MTACRTWCSLGPCCCSERRSAPAALDLEQEKSERLLLNVLPGSIAARLKETEGVIADGFSDVTVLFADIVDFTRRSERITPDQVVEVLNDLFSVFAQLARERGLEKIKTIGDAYMVIGGLPDSPRPRRCGGRDGHGDARGGGRAR